MQNVTLPNPTPVTPALKRKMRRQAYAMAVVALISAVLGAYLVASGALPNQYNLVPGRVATNLIPPSRDYEITVFANNLAAPRTLLAHPEADVIFVTERGGGRVLALQDSNGDRSADSPIIVAEGLAVPSGLAYHEGWLYIAEAGQVSRTRLNPDFSGSELEIIVRGLPTGRNPNEVDSGLHAVHIHNDELYVSVGASCATCLESDSRRATVLVFALDGSNERVYSRGLYLSLGLASNPINGELWATAQGQPLLPSASGHEALYRLENGLNAGWPFCHNADYPDPERAEDAESACEGIDAPLLKMIPQANATGLLFLTHPDFADYENDLVVVLHGGINSAGHQVGLGLIRFEVDPATGMLASDRPHEFMGGFWLSEDPGDHAGRPFDAVLGRNGSIYVSDDASGVIYQLRYIG